MDAPPIPTPGSTPGQGPAASHNIMGKPTLFSEERILNPTSGFKHKLLCDGPTVTAGTACAYDCAYCYVEIMVGTKPYVAKVLGDRDFQDVVIRRRDAVQRLRAELRTARGELKFKGGKYGRARAAGRPMVCYGSPLVDIAATNGLTDETVQMVKILLEDTDWDLRLLSKSPLITRIAQSLADDEKPRVIFGLSTGTFDDELARAIEPSCPSPTKRFQAHRWLQDNGYRTFGMLCPILPQSLDRFVEKVAQEIRPERCEHVWAEALNVRGPSMTRTIAALEGSQFKAEADAVRAISGEGKKDAWEEYAQRTFSALAPTIPRREDGPRLRFLQYVIKKTASWWRERQNDGAVVLGAAGGTQTETPKETPDPEANMDPDHTPPPPTTVAPLDLDQVNRIVEAVAALSNASAEVAKAAAEVAQHCAELLKCTMEVNRSPGQTSPANSAAAPRTGPDPKRSAAAKKAWITIRAKRAAEGRGQS